MNIATYRRRKARLRRACRVHVRRGVSLRNNDIPSFAAYCRAADLYDAAYVALPLRKQEKALASLLNGKLRK